MRQDVGRFHSIIGYGWDEVACSSDLGSASFTVILEPEQGRFVQADPIGLSGGDYSLYRYVANNPVNQIDPSGNRIELRDASWKQGMPTPTYA